ncbi:MAG TPA: cation diffusion facilitator family transporter [Baekduia sp.]|nr:cation diffusion facilitator family transporter [Baekduia sp.]
MSATADSRGQRRTALASIAAATLLVVLKLGTGLVTGSLGLISAGIESSGDVVAAILTFFAIRLGSRPADRDHPYGHRRAENLAALGEAGILLGGGAIVVFEAIRQLLHGSESLEAKWFVFLVIGIALIVDVSRIVVSVRTSRKYNSAALRGNAFHFAADMAGSLAVLCGLLAVRAGFQQGDAVAALVIAFIIFGAAARLIYENARVLMDTAPADAQGRAEAAIRALGNDVDLRRLRLRESGGRFFADVVVGVPPAQAIVEGHSQADAIEDAVRQALPDTDVVVHLEPQRDGLDLRDHALAAALAEPLVREAHDIVIYESGDRRSVSLHLKMPADLALAEAHDVAERVEADLERRPDVEAVQTHLEPLELPVAARAPEPGDPRDDLERQRIARIVEDRTGHGPEELRLLRTDVGLVVFVSVRVGPTATLRDAHELARRIEDDVRRDSDYIADVVVHTEP